MNDCATKKLLQHLQKKANLSYWDDLMFSLGLGNKAKYKKNLVSGGRQDVRRTMRNKAQEAGAFPLSELRYRNMSGTPTAARYEGQLRAAMTRPQRARYEKAWTAKKE